MKEKNLPFFFFSFAVGGWVGGDASVFGGVVAGVRTG